MNQGKCLNRLAETHFYNETSNSAQARNHNQFKSRSVTWEQARLNDDDKLGSSLKCQNEQKLRLQSRHRTVGK